MRQVELDPRAYLMAGGRLGLSEWLQLDEGEQAAFVIAGDEMLRRQAEAIVDVLAERLSAELETAQLEQMADKAIRGVA